MKLFSKTKNGDIKAVKLEKEVIKVRIKSPTSDVCNGDQGGGGVREYSLEGTMAVMLLLVKCYDKK